MTLREPSEIQPMTDAVMRRLSRSSTWNYALSASTHDGSPTLVQHLDQDDEFYYLVTITKKQGITARLAISGDGTELLEVEGIQEDGTALPPYVDPIAILDAAARRRSAPNSAIFRPALIGRHPVLVWKSCQQSTTRFLPFWLVTIRDRLLYIRVDGTVFTKLTTTGHG
jgi:hypothetical protein